MEPQVRTDETGKVIVVPERARPEHETCNTKEFKVRFDQLKADRSNTESTWDQIERFFMPLTGGGRPNVQLSEGAVTWQRQEVWDSTAIDSAQKLAASIHGSVTSPAIRWFKLAWRDSELRKDAECCEWLEDVGDAVYEALQDSDFNSEIASADHELVGYGNAFVIEEVAEADAGEWEGVDFTAVPLREGYFEQDSKGGIKRFYRRLSWNAVQCVDKFTAEGVPDDIREAAEKGTNLSRQWEVVYCVFPRDERRRELRRAAKRNAERAKMRCECQAAQEKARAGGIPPPEAPQITADEPLHPLAPHMRPIGGVYFLADSGERLGLEEQGYYEMPVCLARWYRTAGSQWGHGQCHVLLPTVKYLNGWMETEHQAAAKAVDPAIGTTERGILSDYDLEPGGVTVFASKDDCWTIESKARFDVAENVKQDLRAMVQRGLHNDELQLKDSPAMTATEVQARYELMNRVLGSTLARIENDLLSPIVHITIGHLMRAGQLPAMPDKVRAKYGDGSADFDIEYQGPLARSQRTDEVAAIERVLSFAAGLLKMGIPLQVIQATIDVVKAIEEVARRLGTPAALLKDEKSVKDAVDEFQKMQQRAAEAQASQAEGEAAAKHAQAKKHLADAAAAQAQGAGARGAPAAPPGGGGPASGLPIPATPTPMVTPPYMPTQQLGGAPASMP